MAHHIPNFEFRNSVPIKNSEVKVRIPAIALGNLAANSFIPNSFMDITCIQINNGGFSQNGWKLICTRSKFPLTIISRALSAKLISSQSNKWALPRECVNKRALKTPIIIIVKDVFNC